jgi:hypothetical protein
MLRIIFESNKIIFTRIGTNPSLQYKIQESLLLHNLLDELEIVAYGIPTDIVVTDVNNADGQQQQQEQHSLTQAEIKSFHTVTFSKKNKNQ